MAGPDLQIVGQILETREGVVQFARTVVHRASLVGHDFQQIRAANIADKQEVAGEQPHRKLAGGAIGDEKTDVLGRVSGRVQHGESHVPDADHIAFDNFCRAI